MEFESFQTVDLIFRGYVNLQTSPNLLPAVFCTVCSSHSAGKTRHDSVSLQGKLDNRFETFYSLLKNFGTVLSLTAH